MHIFEEKKTADFHRHAIDNQSKMVKVSAWSLV